MRDEDFGLTPEKKVINDYKKRLRTINSLISGKSDKKISDDESSPDKKSPIHMMAQSQKSSNTSNSNTSINNL